MVAGSQAVSWASGCPSTRRSRSRRTKPALARRPRRAATPASIVSARLEDRAALLASLCLDRAEQAVDRAGWLLDRRRAHERPSTPLPRHDTLGLQPAHRFADGMARQPELLGQLGISGKRLSEVAPPEPLTQHVQQLRPQRHRAGPVDLRHMSQSTDIRSLAQADDGSSSYCRRRAWPAAGSASLVGGDGGSGTRASAHSRPSIRGT